MRLKAGLLLTMLAILGSGQDASRFEGKWQARLKEEVICTIELGAGETPRGAMIDCRVNIDADGNLTEADPSDDPDQRMPISKARIASGVLTFQDKEGDDTEVLKFEMRIVGGDVAELLLVNFPAGVKPKPIRFTRLSSNR
ncbi:MAG: hypothetical protein JNL98_30665 [Bryobacterales bacterium]|nr:hypothetical protein [Bryobacterales bacterium]